jgi:hypothetical protein
MAWYFAIIYNGQLYWVGSNGLSITPVPLLVYPPVALQDLMLLNTSLAPGTNMSFLMFLADMSGIKAYDFVFASVKAPSRPGAPASAPINLKSLGVQIEKKLNQLKR